LKSVADCRVAPEGYLGAMAQERKLTKAQRATLQTFFSMLDENDLARLDASVDNYSDSTDWWFRTEINAELQRRRNP
jgi:hypothetical protein